MANSGVLHMAAENIEETHRADLKLLDQTSGGPIFEAKTGSVRPRVFRRGDMVYLEGELGTLKGNGGASWLEVWLQLPEWAKPADTGVRFSANVGPTGRVDIFYQDEKGFRIISRSNFEATWYVSLWGMCYRGKPL